MSAHMRPKNKQTQRISTNSSATVHETRNDSKRCNGALQVRVRNRSQVASSAFTPNFSMSQASPEPQPTNYSSATFLDCDATESFLKKEQKAGVWLFCAFSVFLLFTFSHVFVILAVWLSSLSSYSNRQPVSLGHRTSSWIQSATENMK